MDKMTVQYVVILWVVHGVLFVFFVQTEDGIRYLVRSRGLGDVYKRQALTSDGCTIMGRDELVGAIGRSITSCFSFAIKPDLSLIHI